MDKKIIFHLLGNALAVFAIIFILPITYAATVMQNFLTTIFFVLLGIFAGVVGIIFSYIGRNHRRRLPVAESALAMLLIYPVLAIIGVIPFLFTESLSPLNAALDTVSNLTSAGISLLPGTAPYILRLWQSVLMWFGSLIFLILLVTVMPEVSGCFGVSMSLQEGQSFSPLFGQMLEQSKKILKVYSLLTIISVALFKLAGLSSWDSILMAMRCISTGGGDFFPARRNIFVEYAAILTMLTACGNFLFFYRLIYTIPPPEIKSDKNIFLRTSDYFQRLKQNIFTNIKIFFTNSEVKAIWATIFLGVGFIVLSTFHRGIFIGDDGDALRTSLFHVISFISTTGIILAPIDLLPDFDRYLIFMMAIFGGCMGSVTGGLKMIRLVVLLKVTAAEIKKTMHPQMISRIRVNKKIVPTNIIGRILCFFFLSVITLFISSAVLSFSGSTFSDAVAMAVACITNTGILPGICEPSNFIKLSVAGKIFCMIILIVGRLEIFALLIIPAALRFRAKNRKW